ncbi:MAG: aldo/keto reductase [Candidatus Microbacterium stercoravium]
MTTSPRFHSRPLADLNRPYAAADDRYDAFEYRQVGASGLYLPPISLGLWWNFGDNIPMDNQRALLRHAFDRGITHFDLANNYGPPYGSAEKNFGRIYREDLAPYRDELIISSKAGYDMWRGPYGDWASRKYIVASAERSLRSMNLDYVDIFYSHRPDPVTPIEETIGALDALVKQGKALYVGISSYSAEQTLEAKAIARSLGTPLVIHQPSYSIINRWIEGGLTDALRQEGMGAIAFVPLAQGVLTNKYLGDSAAERAQQRGSLGGTRVTPAAREQLRTLDALARQRGQTLAQMALQWVLRDGVVTSALIGASRPDQIDENVRALEGAAFDAEECEIIDRAAELIGEDFWESE